MKHAGKVVMMDNEITDVEFAMIDTALSGGVGECDVAFIKNEYKKYTGTKVHYRDEEEMIVSDAFKVFLDKIGIDDDAVDEFQDEVDWSRFDDIIGHYTLLV